MKHLAVHRYVYGGLFVASIVAFVVLRNDIMKHLPEYKTGGPTGDATGYTTSFQWLLGWLCVAFFVIGTVYCVVVEVRASKHRRSGEIGLGVSPADR